MRRIDYKSITEADGKEAKLSIFPPPAWMEAGLYSASVGGQIVANAVNEKHAEELLLTFAIGHCDGKIRLANALIKHYGAQRRRLVREGLKKI